MKNSLVGVAIVGILAGALALAPAASADDNYAPQLPGRVIAPNAKVPLEISGAQPGCRITYSVRSVGGADNVNRGLVRRTRVAVADDGVASSSLRAPSTPGAYQLITRVDNFPGQTGCTPSKSVQRFIVR